MLFNIKTLRELIRHDPETGRLYWRPRDRDLYVREHHWRDFNNRRAGKLAESKCPTRGYMKVTIRLLGDECIIRSHRLMWALVNDAWPSGDIDHINGDRSDNRLINLRDVTREENAKNASRSKNNTSGVVGVNFCNTRKRWVAKGFLFGRRKHLGYYHTMEEATDARKDWENVNGYHPNHGRDNPRWVRNSER